MRFFVSLFLIFYTILGAYADDRELIAKNKADFIINIATNINLPSTENSEEFKIGLYGRGRDVGILFDELDTRSATIQLDNKNIKVFHFKRTRNIEQVDLLYVEGDSKIRISDINEKLEGHPYLILTENFPFGTSMINLALNSNNEVFYELQPEPLERRGISITKSLLNSDRRITSEEQWISLLTEAVKMVDKQSKTITKQETEIKKRDRLITNQQIAIGLITILILTISALAAKLIQSNKIRKAAHLELKQKNKDIIDSLNYAKRIQKAFLPQKELFKKYFSDCFILFKPKDIVSGDFYWLHKNNDILYFAVADCTGHGVPGAIISVMCSDALTKVVGEFGESDPAEILNKTAELLDSILSNGDANINDGMDIAFCKLNFKTKELLFAGANTPLHYIRNNELSTIKADRQAIGKVTERRPYTTHHLELQKDDRIYLTTDGFADQFGGEHDKKLKARKLRDLFLQNHKLTMEEQNVFLNNFLKEWTGSNEQVDDICVFACRI
ncbi:YfiR/HmsC family protein [Carboxylicivirga sp. N1Y90]|uniref:YfiR/HmsC family protein n=1 Tax=Carboxylicivirga fragile TaxID=3417571 RepID=UPI003D34A7C3|nr:DUF4154 domain-containing protein [Marinilabiliaceae bacterium N1Y90]